MFGKRPSEGAGPTPVRPPPPPAADGAAIATATGGAAEADVAGDDTVFARELYALYNVTVLPGSFLAREARGHNPGAGRIRMALVAETAECLEAAHRMARFIKAGRPS